MEPHDRKRLCCPHHDILGAAARSQGMVCVPTWLGVTVPRELTSSQGQVFTVTSCLWTWQVQGSRSESCSLSSLTLTAGTQSPLRWAAFICKGLLGWLSGKQLTCQCRRQGFDLWVRKMPWRRKWQPTPVFFLKNPVDRGAWRATPHGVTVGHDWECRFHMCSWDQQWCCLFSEPQ